MKMYTTMNFPVSFVMSKFGYEPFDIENAYIIENHTGIKDIMKPLKLSTTMGGSGDEGGRPEVDEDSMKSDSSDAQNDAGEVVE